MHILHRHGLKLAAVALLCLICPYFVRAADETAFTKEQIKNFLLTAKVVKSQRSSIGITHPWRLTLTDGTVTHDASFQAVDEHEAMKQLSSGTEVGFVDSYKYNIAAYRLAELLGLDDMLPVYVERKWQGNPGSISWWLPVKMDEGERRRKNLKAPDLDAWNNQMYRIRVFDQLVDDTDANLTNVLIGEDWKIWRIDFTRAFRSQKELKDPQANLVRCDRHLLEKLKTLDAKEVAEKTKHYLDKDDVKAVMARRDKIVEHFQKLVAEKGGSAVLY
jgi:hypothetical protein